MIKYNIGDLVTYGGIEYFICAISTMVYDDDCGGEPEWKITKEVQEVSLCTPFTGDRTFEFHKPFWIRVSELEKNQ